MTPTLGEHVDETSTLLDYQPLTVNNEDLIFSPISLRFPSAVRFESTSLFTIRTHRGFLGKSVPVGDIYCFEMADFPANTRSISYHGREPGRVYCKKLLVVGLPHTEKSVREFLRAVLAACAFLAIIIALIAIVLVNALASHLS